MRAALERQRYLVDFTLASMARRRGRTLALLTAFTLVVAAVASVLFLTEALRREASRLLRDAPEIVVQRLAAGRHELFPEERLGTLQAIRGVAGVRPRLWGYWYDAGVKANYTVLVPGEFPFGDGDAIVGPAVARLRALEPGGRILLRAHDGEPLLFTVREVLPEEAELVSGDVVALSAAGFRRLFGLAPGRFTDVAVAVPNPREVGTVAAKIARELPDVRAVTREEIRRTYEAIFDWRGGLAILVLGGAVLALALLAWEKASGLSAEERREIGLLKGLGWETGDVLRMKAWEGGLVAGGAFLAGACLAWVHVFLLGAPVIAPVLRGWSGLHLELRLVPSIGPDPLAILFLLTVVPYLLATVVPSWRAATSDPDEVMRS